MTYPAPPAIPTMRSTPITMPATDPPERPVFGFGGSGISTDSVVAAETVGPEFKDNELALPEDREEGKVLVTFDGLEVDWKLTGGVIGDEPPPVVRSGVKILGA